MVRTELCFGRTTTYNGGIKIDKGEQMTTYRTQGVCASEIHFEIEQGTLKNVRFTDGCSGNLEAIGRLVEGMPIAEVMRKLRGIVCQNGTSCADQLVTALEEAAK